MTPRPPHVALMLVAAVMTGASGCTPYVDRYNYTPQPAELTFNANRTDASPDARALISVVGIRRKAAETMDRPGVEIKVRVENLGEETVRFDPGAVAMVTAKLDRLDEPLSPPEPAALEPGDSTIVLLRFPLPEDAGAAGKTLAGFNARLTLEVAGQRLTRSVSFQRRRDGYDRFYYHPYHAYPFRSHHGYDDPY